MTPEQFVQYLKLPAISIEERYKIPYLFTIGQAALESNWGKSAIGKNLFGIKAGATWKGLKQLVTTTEYFDKDIHRSQFPEVIKVEQVNGKFKYTVKDYFRDYETTEDCLEDHAQFLITNKRYKKAFDFTDPYKFAEQVALAGYATAPNYYDVLCSMINSVKKRI